MSKSVKNPVKTPEQKKDKPDPFMLLTPRQHYFIAMRLAFGSAIASLTIGILPFIGIILSSFSLLLGFFHVRVGDWKTIEK